MMFDFIKNNHAVKAMAGNYYGTSRNSKENPSTVHFTNKQQRISIKFQWPSSPFW